MKKIIKKIYYKIEFELASPMTIGTGENQFTDKDIARNSKGVPYIPGTALAGINRSFFDDNEEKERINKYFGNVSMEQIVESRIVFYDAQIADEEESYMVSNRDMVALDLYKTAIVGAKFDMETLEPGIKFVTYMEQNYLDKNDEAIADEIVNHWLRNEVYLGAKTMRGYGAIRKVKVWKIAFGFASEDKSEKTLVEWLAFDMYRKSDWESAELVEKPEEESRYMLQLELKQVGGISIRRYTTQLLQNEQEAVPDYEQLTVHEKEEILPVIPGTSWAGAFRHRMQQLVPDLNNKLCFGVVDEKEKVKSNIRFSETQISKAKAKIYSRNTINRFTGGTVDGALFTEKAYYGGETTLVISFGKAPEDKVKYALAAAIADLHHGFLAVGGLTSIGRGCFQVKKVNGKEVEGDDIYQKAWELMKDW
ncbi:MAG: hypothetical protein IKM28_00695 [Lachnospiraceae bacterium]|nr:hypothetical protein [Lachnospiraceae bacterium]